MNDPLKELEKQFATFIELKDSERFFLSFTEYLRFIQETPPLHTVARKILSNRSLFEINNLYKTLQRAWLEDDNAAEKIWADIDRKFLGLSTKYDISLLGRFSEIRMVGGIIRVFHMQMVEGVKLAGLTKSKTIEKRILKIPVASGTFYINADTGLIRLNKVEKTLNITGKEFRVILTLANNDNNQATYSELINGEDTKSKKRSLAFAIRNLKKYLGILPKKRSKNKDIIKNIKKYGYKLIT